MNAMVRDALALLLVVSAALAVGIVLGNLIWAGEWWSAGLLAGALAATGVARVLGRYDPAAVAAGRQHRAAERAGEDELRNRATSG